METLEIGTVFTDLKRQFIQQCDIQKAPDELYLWFTEIYGVLSVHDMEDHSKNMTIAILKGGGPSLIKLLEDSSSYIYLMQVIQDSTGGQEKFKVSQKINFDFRLCGRFPTRFL